jgi:type II secretory pathway component GspD/PulD (secretin)
VIPIVDTSTVDTIVRIKDGVTIVIGGLIKDERVKTKSKVPILGSLPGLGRLFSSDDNRTEKTEIVIFLTPHIISGDVHVDPDLLPRLKEDKIYN